VRPSAPIVRGLSVVVVLVALLSGACSSDATDVTSAPVLEGCDAPRANTPAGGYGAEMPPPILSGCDGPLVVGAPDLRGTWKVVGGETGGAPLPAGHPVWDHVERIEQVGDRVVITAEGIIHDMVVDGTYESGVRDVMSADFTTPIEVAASFERGVLVLRPKGVVGVEILRWREGDQLVWRYHSMFTARLERIDGGSDVPRS